MAKRVILRRFNICGKVYGERRVLILEEPPYPTVQDILTDDGEAWEVTAIEDTEIIAKVPRG